MAENLLEDSFILPYENSLKASEWAVQRVDTWDNNLDKFFGLGIPLVSGIIIQALTKAQTGLDYVFIASAILALVFGGFTIWRGKNLTTKEGIWINDPNKLLSEGDWIKKQKSDYRYSMIKQLGIQFTHNQNLVARKRKAANKAIFLITSAIILAGLVLLNQPRLPQSHECSGQTSALTVSPIRQ